MKLTECMSVEKKELNKKSGKIIIFFGQYQTKVATVHLARNMWLLSLKWQWSSIPLGQIGTLAGKKWVERKKSEKYHVANYIYKDFKNCKVRNSLYQRVNIAPCPCEIKEKFTLSYLGKLILSKYSDTVESFHLDNYEFIGITLSLLG